MCNALTSFSYIFLWLSGFQHNLIFPAQWLCQADSYVSTLHSLINYVGCAFIYCMSDILKLSLQSYLFIDVLPKHYNWNYTWCPFIPCTFIFTWHIFWPLLYKLKWKLHKGRAFCLFYSILYSQNIEQCLGCSTVEC